MEMKNITFLLSMISLILFSARTGHKPKKDSLTQHSQDSILWKNLGTAREINVLQIVLDVDSFKPINHRYGQNVGDKILCMIANKFVNFVGSSGILQGCMVTVCTVNSMRTRDELE